MSRKRRARPRSPWFKGRALMECVVVACATRLKLPASDAADSTPACPNCGSDMLTVKLTADVRPELFRRKKRKRRVV